MTKPQGAQAPIKENKMTIKYQYTIKDTDGTTHTFKTLKQAKASRIGFSAGGLRIIAQVRI